KIFLATNAMVPDEGASVDGLGRRKFRFGKVARKLLLVNSFHPFRGVTVEQLRLRSFVVHTFLQPPNLQRSPQISILNLPRFSAPLGCCVSLACGIFAAERACPNRHLSLTRVISAANCILGPAFLPLELFSPSIFGRTALRLLAPRNTTRFRATSRRSHFVRSLNGLRFFFRYYFTADMAFTSGCTANQMLRNIPGS